MGRYENMKDKLDYNARMEFMHEYHLLGLAWEDFLFIGGLFVLCLTLCCVFSINEYFLGNFESFSDFKNAYILEIVMFSSVFIVTLIGGLITNFYFEHQFYKKWEKKVKKNE